MNADAPVDRPPTKGRSNVPLFAMVFLIVLILGVGAKMAWMLMTYKADLSEAIATIVSLRQELDDVNKDKMMANDEIAAGDTAARDEGVSDLEAELMLTKVQLAAMASRDVWQVFARPDHPDEFYYVTNGGTGTIWKYDRLKDPSYRETGSIRIAEGSSVVHDVTLQAGAEVRPVGFTDDKFVYAITGEDNSPGPCFSDWHYRSLEYVDLDDPSDTGTFDLTEELDAMATAEEAACEASMVL